MKLSTAHVSTACVRTRFQMEYALKGYMFDCVHTLMSIYKNKLYFGLYSGAGSAYAESSEVSKTIKNTETKLCWMKWTINYKQLNQKTTFLKRSFPVAQMVEHGASNAKIMGSISRESKS